MAAPGRIETATEIETVGGMGIIPPLAEEVVVAVVVVINMGLQQELTIESLLRICHPGSVGKTSRIT